MSLISGGDTWGLSARCHLWFLLLEGIELLLDALYARHPCGADILSEHKGSSRSLQEGKALKKALAGAGKDCPKPWFFVVMLAFIASSSEVSKCLQ